MPIHEKYNITIKITSSDEQGPCIELNLRDILRSNIIDPSYAPKFRNMIEMLENEENKLKEKGERRNDKPAKNN